MIYVSEKYINKVEGFDLVNNEVYYDFCIVYYLYHFLFILYTIMCMIQ